MAWIIYWLCLVVTLGVWGFAIAVGGRPERYGALLRLIVTIAGVAVSRLIITLHGPMSVWGPVANLTETAVTSFGFLYLAMRFGSGWLALAMMIQALQFYTSRVFLDGETANHAVYSVEENLITLAVALCLFAATLASIRARRLARNATEKRAASDAKRVAQIAAFGGSG